MHQYSAYQYFRAYLVWAEQSCSRLAPPPPWPAAILERDGAEEAEAEPRLGEANDITRA